MQALFESVLKRSSRADVLERVGVDGPEAYEARIVAALMALGGTYEELWHVVTMLRDADNFHEIRALLKLYTIDWITLSDVVAVLINEVYDLGYGEQNVDLMSVLKNRHVRRTTLPQIIKRHKSLVHHDIYSRIRNDIVHRGKLEDQELDAIYNEWLSRSTLLAYMKPTEVVDRASALLAAAVEMRLHDRVRAFVLGRAEALMDHLRATRRLLDDVGDVLVAKLAEQNVDSTGG